MGRGRFKFSTGQWTGKCNNQVCNLWNRSTGLRTEYGEALSPNAGKYGREKIRLRTLLTQCISLNISIIQENIDLQAHCASIKRSASRVLRSSPSVLYPISFENVDVLGVTSFVTSCRNFFPGFYVTVIESICLDTP